MRGVNEEMRRVTNTSETINAAATAIASSENRVPQASVQKRRWGSCWSIYWCFGSRKHKKRIRHAVFFPETTVLGAEVSASENPIQAPTIVLPFVAPPSSPASFLQSDPASATQSPTGLLSLTSMSANMYSPGPASIFATGPYAHETQLVSPPVFSTITTEPSTAPFTPPPESVQFTTPSSPEVPFARLLDPNCQNGEASQRFCLTHYEFQSYQLYPGSPVGHLISPSSGISGSGTSSPFPDREFAPGGLHFPEFCPSDPPTLLNLDKLSPPHWGSRFGSGSLTPNAAVHKSSNGFLLDCQNSDIAPLTNSFSGWQNGENGIDHRVSFEIATEVVRCVEKKPLALATAVSASLENAACGLERGERPREMPEDHGYFTGAATDNAPELAFASADEGEQQYHKHRSITLGSVKEFNFDNADGVDSDKASGSSDWWANEQLLGKETVLPNNWTFFPMMQSGVS